MPGCGSSHDAGRPTYRGEPSRTPEVATVRVMAHTLATLYFFGAGRPACSSRSAPARADPARAVARRPRRGRAGRLGAGAARGDEFPLLLPGTRGPDARDLVLGICALHPDVSLSCGVTQYGFGESASQLMRGADRALRRKLLGRGRAELCDGAGARSAVQPPLASTAGSPAWPVPDPAVPSPGHPTRAGVSRSVTAREDVIRARSSGDLRRTASWQVPPRPRGSRSRE